MRSLRIGRAERAASPSARRVGVAGGAALALLSATWAQPAEASAGFVPAATQELVALLTPHDARSAPHGGSRLVEVVRARRPITAVRTVLPVSGRAEGTNGVSWLRVRLPGRPNGRTAWIRERSTVSSSTRWHVAVDISSRQTTIYHSGKAVRRFRSVVGRRATPTPRGLFFVEEVIALRPGDVGAPYALALSARSNVLQEFAGGPGQIGVHGLANVGGVLGTAVSHGCVRLTGAAMRWIVTRIHPGVPVTVTS
jgi:lipoprotein-anchoring transpeptidase ErfK/SrfK